MGREVCRVPLDFDWPQNKVWEGFLMPDRFDEISCPDCESGYSPQAQNLYDFWYGKIPFDPASTGSAPWRHDSPAVRVFAERNVSNAPDFYGTGEFAIVHEAQRLASLFNGQWSHHLSQDDVDALVAGGRLYDFTHVVVPGKGWQPKDPPVTPTAAEVNEWSLQGMGHDSINAHVAIKARCKREGVDDTCPTCKGRGSLERYEGQRAEAEAWEPTDPPKGDGWQLWETVSEGSPVSPVFDSADGLAGWMSDPARGDRWVPGDVARKFVDEGWAPTGVISPGRGFHSGVEAIGWNDKS
jgi:hypothetical protein